MDLDGGALSHEIHQPIYHVVLYECRHYTLFYAALLQKGQAEALQHRTILLLLEDLT